MCENTIKNDIKTIFLAFIFILGETSLSPHACQVKEPKRLELKFRLKAKVHSKWTKT